MDNNIIDVVLRQIRDKQAQLAEALASRAAKNYEEYQFICGEIRGLTAVEMYLMDLAKNLEQFDEWNSNRLKPR